MNSALFKTLLDAEQQGGIVNSGRQAGELRASADGPDGISHTIGDSTTDVTALGTGGGGSGGGGGGSGREDSGEHTGNDRAAGTREGFAVECCSTWNDAKRTEAEQFISRIHEGHTTPLGEVWKATNPIAVVGRSATGLWAMAIGCLIMSRGVAVFNLYGTRVEPQGATAND
eukprot:4720827-Prymnesium_polylepis.1